MGAIPWRCQNASIQEMASGDASTHPDEADHGQAQPVAGGGAVHQNGTVLFPRSGCEQLLGQIFNLGVAAHDDLCDGLTTLLQGLVNQGLELPKIHWIEA